MMCLTALILFVASIKIDATFDFRGYLNAHKIYWLNLEAEGARAFLASISGALITVLGVVFSLTLLLISHVSNQFSPRVLANFMEHRSIKFTLGILISTFLFNVLALFSVRSGEEGSQPFVSETSLMIAFVLTTVCVFTLIHFFNHIPQSIRLCNILKDIGEKFSSDLSKLVSKNQKSQLYLKKEVLSSQIKKDFKFFTVKSNQSGYINDFIEKKISEVSKEHECYVVFHNYLGDYVHKGSILAQVYMHNSSHKQIEGLVKTVCEDLNRCISLDTEKQSRSDITYQADQMIEIAAKALSPGINDPHSANSALDWLFDGIFITAESDLCEFDHQTDEKGNLTYSKPGLTGSNLIKYIIVKCMPYFKTDLNSALYLFTKINLLIESQKKVNCRPFLEECSQILYKCLQEKHQLTGFELDAFHDEDLIYGSKFKEKKIGDAL